MPLAVYEYDPSSEEANDKEIDPWVNLALEIRWNNFNQPPGHAVATGVANANSAAAEASRISAIVADYEYNPSFDEANNKAIESWLSTSAVKLRWNNFRRQAGQAVVGVVDARPAAAEATRGGTQAVVGSGTEEAPVPDTQQSQDTQQQNEGQGINRTFTPAPQNTGRQGQL
ncbi:hypothetical protein BaRGS_00014894 [Batillaria attramentaria]|uniref:Uncharacterized protein n=1 Tax=Batillaria attramentaria TaxID=370345 RepID=A0ABD0L358_9CAEN